MERNLLDEAYRKLKGSVYMDKTVPYIRSEIAKFENENFENKMEEILEAVNNEKQWKPFEAGVLDSIKAFTFPKKIFGEMNGSNEPIIISNICSEGVSVEEYNNFIDISIEGHIIGVLWILLIGYKIDEKLFENCFGNRLCDRLVFSEDKVSESPSLFKPYYNQYESWRNQGLRHAKNIVNQENHSVIITMLDLTRYYYNIDYTESMYRKVTDVKEQSNEARRINALIYKIIKRYSECLGNKKNVMLPIGFLPSNILANVYLYEFDICVSKCSNTSYYGRYVDDMILVSRIEPAAKLKSKIAKNGVNEVSSYIIKKLENEGVIESVGNDIRLLGYEGLVVKKDKFRFFYVDKNGYDTIIEKIKNDIEQNTSEFNFLPENSVTELNEDILEFEREDTVNKLRALNGVSINKYALSKAIGKNVKMSPYAEKKAINTFIKSIDQILNHREIISNYTIWEGVLNYYVINNKWDEVQNFTVKIISALRELDESTSKIGVYEYLNNTGIYSVGDTLIKYYISCLTRAMAIVFGKNIKDVLEKISNNILELKRYDVFQKDLSVKSMNKMRKYYCKARMVNNSLIPISIEECMTAFSANDKSDKVVCFNNLEDYFNSNEHHRYYFKNLKYKPYISTPFEIIYTYLLGIIKRNDLIPDDNSCLDMVCEKYGENFFSKDPSYLRKCINGEVSEYDENIIITENDHYDDENCNGKYRVAVANVKMRNSDFEDILAGKKRSISKRCTEISKIMNEAIRYKSDLLIFPEAYIPITYLPVIQAKAARHNMVVIGGVEHIKSGNLVYNLTVTLMPINNDRMKYVVPFFHPKIYYSPAEEKAIIEHKCVPVKGNSHTLFRWNNLSFITFCCYELTSLEKRSIFKREADIVFGVEWNRDTNYFSNIIESLSRDRCCFCAQSNMSDYGDSRIVQPTKSQTMNIARVKGGINGTVIIDEVDVIALRKHKDSPAEESEFKPLPAGYSIKQ